MDPTRAARAALLASVLAAGCAVRADLGRNDGDGNDVDAQGPREAAMEVAPEVAMEVAPEAAMEVAPEAAMEVAPEAAMEVAPSERDAAGAPAPADAGAPASCDDNLLDGDETDIDCGGSCAPCGLAQRCEVAADCGTWPGCDPLLGCACDAQTKTCVYNHCSDYLQDFGETAVDCGGGECGGCGPQKACVLDSDCSQSLPGCGPGGCTCDVNTSTCVYDHCFDHKNDVDETGVDCGGILCGGCPQGVACGLDTDCLSQACDAVSRVCVSNQCADHHQDGAESDVDCGGGDCGPCSVGRKCVSNFDCATGGCAGFPRLCQ
jgi:hypothetical protein